MHTIQKLNLPAFSYLFILKVRILNPAEGAALCVGHYNSEVCSVVTYATQYGGNNNNNNTNNT